MFKYGRMPNYSLAGQILECVKERSYLGIILEQPMTFTSHINHTVSKASKVLNLLPKAKLSYMMVNAQHKQKPLPISV